MRSWWVALVLIACKEPRDEVATQPTPAPAHIPTPPPMKDIDDIGDPNAPAPTAADWSASKTCAVQDAELVYVVDDSNGFYSFDPRKLPGNNPFHRIGTLRCTGSSTPNSMAIDRKGVAWIGYQNGKVYRASIIDAKCDKQGWKPAGKPTRAFGMGYVTKGPRTEEELLFVAGGVDDPTYQLATIDTEQKTWTKISSLSKKGHPELTGTSEGRLFGYYPTPGRGFVQEIDRATGAAIGRTWRIPGDPLSVDAYAFAHYGGVFYVFTTADGESSVHAVNMQTGKAQLVRKDLPYSIVGAGVSTCAPLLEQPPTP
ncbi:MAG: hypothetical protein ACKV2T_42890 [Kofleriaceae bacterium]